MISRLAQRSAGTSEGSKVAHEISCEDFPAQQEDEKPSTDLTPSVAREISAEVVPISSPPQMRAGQTSEDEALVSSSSSEPEVFQRPQRPLKPAPKGIFFKKRKRTDFECDYSKGSGEDFGKCELDELFPTPKFEKCKSDQNQNKKSREVEKKSYYVETIEDIFG